MGRAPCCDKNELKKGPWTAEEDRKLIDFIKKNGCGNWRFLPKNAGLQRCGKSCRLRWTNYLRPDIRRGKFSFEEEETIIKLHSILGNKWSAIAARLPGRTDNEIKNYWNTHIRKKLLRMGIDPVTHSPRLDLLDFSSILRSSLYNSSQINLSRLLGVQTLVNPEILRLATSLISNNNSQTKNTNLFFRNLQGNQFPNTQIQNHMPPLVHGPIQENTNCVPFSTSETQLMEPSNFSNFNTQTSEPKFEKITSDVTVFSPQVSEWPSSSLLEDFILQDFSTIDPRLYENSFFQTNVSYVSGLSNLSTPTSSSTPLDSHSTYINDANITTTDDERESNCSGDFFNFEIPHMLDFNDFM